MKLREWTELTRDLERVIRVRPEGTIEILDAPKIRRELTDDLVRLAVFAGDGRDQVRARKVLWALAEASGIFPCSIQELYEAMGKGKHSGFTVPAINIRGLTYDVARAVFRAAIKAEVGAFIFEIARSEIGYTSQRPGEYAAVILAAGIKEGFVGPLFIQGDHYQVSAKRYQSDPEAELKAIRSLIQESIAAGFFNIDIDSSTLVDLSRASLEQQQRLNYELVADLTAYIRKLQPSGIQVSVGGEIGEVGKKNSTVEELRAFMDGLKRELAKRDGDLKGISKISIQTGTTHGGVPLPDGRVAEVKLDFDTLERLSQVARREYGLSGAVQHGASTLPSEVFHLFPQRGAAEIHLATEFQNMIYEDPAFPADLRQEIYGHLKQDPSSERKEGETEEQFIYKNRKRAFGPFKERFWGLPEEVRGQISSRLEGKFAFLFEKLNVIHSKEMVEGEVKSRAPRQRLPQDLSRISSAAPTGPQDWGVPGEGE
ncbi:MAG: class II fructose-bisphosphate aldolase [candidate division NC10 bacterium]|nr:class II fructose-bisphosphate aldolase [candidate division NC10 bacterium]